MTISEIKKMEIGNVVEVTGMLCRKDILTKPADGSPYLMVAVQDKTGTIEFPVWKRFEAANAALEIGNIYKVSGTLGEYKKVVQISYPTFYPAENENPEEYVPAFEVSAKDVERFHEIIGDFKDERYRKFLEACFNWKIKDSTVWELFYNVPAAVKHHHNKVHGTFIHTLTMMEQVLALKKIYGDHALINYDRLITKVVLHDISKTREYSYPVISRNPIKMDHMAMGAAFIMNVNDSVNILESKEIDDLGYAILSHHGEFGGYEIRTLEDEILHCVDMIDSRINNETQTE